MPLRFLERNAGRHPEDVAIVDRGERISHGELFDRVQRLAYGLSTRGIGRGDRVALLLANSIDFIVSFYAIAACRAIAVPVDINCRSSELAFYLADAGISLIITDGPRTDLVASVVNAAPNSVQVVTHDANQLDLPTLQELTAKRPAQPLAARDENDDLIWLYTSGSTGRPRCVPRTTGQCLSELNTMVTGLALDKTDAIFCAIPLYHNYGIVECMFAAAGSRARLVVLDNPSPFAIQRHRALKLMEKEGATVFPTVPYIVKQLAQGKPNDGLTSLRICYAAAAPLTNDVAEAFFVRFGIPVVPHYGCTETGAVTIHSPTDGDQKPGAVGKAMPGVEIKIIDENGSSLPPGQIGEVTIRTPAMTRGYRDDSSDQDQIFRGGFFHSGDLGRLDRDGNLYLTGRKKFLINILGQKFSPIEVEDTLQSHEHVDDALVLGVPSENGEESILRAYVTLTGPCGERELARYCRDRLARFKVPQRIDFVSVIPKDLLGKKLRDLSTIEQHICGTE